MNEISPPPRAGRGAAAPAGHPPPLPPGTGERRRRPQRSRAGRFWRRQVQKRLSRPLAALAAVAVPALYMAYMRLVWATSRIESGNFPDLHAIIARHNGAVGLLWHEEVMTVAYGYHHLGFRPHTLASVGQAGEVIARMLRRCGFVVFRGGSTTGGSRRREGTLEAMIEHMRTHDEVIYGLTVDGSKGPAYRMKTGGIVIARECGRPVILARTWYKRCVRLPTWDRMAVPLPFNVISHYLRGPYEVPQSARTQEGLERFRDQLEAELIVLAAQSYTDLGQAVPAALRQRMATAVTPTGAAEQAA